MSWHYEYGWSSRFENGEEYEWLGGMSFVEASRQAREYQREEDETYRDAESGRLTYVVQRRKVVTPGPWEPVSDEEES